MKKAQQKRSIFWFAMGLFLTELGIVFLVVPHSWVSLVAGYDRGFVYSWFGQAFESKVMADAASWFDALFVRTGIQDASYDFLIGQWDAQGDIQIDDRGLSALTADRLQTSWAAVSVAMYRLSEMAQWMVLIIPLLIAALVDGLTQHEINKWRYFVPSPLVQHASRGAIYGLIALGLLVPFAPVPLYAPITPVLMACVVLFFWMALANLGKRL